MNDFEEVKNPPHCVVHNRFHILGPDCIASKSELEEIQVVNEVEVKAEIAELTIMWSHAVREAVKREALWQSNGGPLRKQAADLEKQIHSTIFYHNLHPKEEANAEVESTGRDS